MGRDELHKSELKTCSKCRRSLRATTDFFYARRRNTDGLDAQCRDCVNTYKRSYRESGGEEVRAYYREYGQRPHARAKEISRKTEYRIENLERMRRLRADWKKRNRDRERVYNARRRQGYVSRSLKATLAKELVMEQEGRCAWCESPLSNDFHLDHIVPLSRGGGSERSNFVLACPPCNVSKGAKLLEEWRPELAR